MLVFHGGARSPLPGGFVGVDLFFVLSGFLITTLLLEEWSRSGRISLPGFYVRRARRLLPALVATIAFVGVIYLIYPRLDTGMGYLASAASALFYASDFAISLGHSPALLGHTWSLAIEEQFYLLWPPLLYLALRRSWAPRKIAVVAFAAACASALDRAAVWLARTNWHVYYRPDARADGLLLGAALAGINSTRGGEELVRRIAARSSVAALASAGLVLFGLAVGEQDAFVYLGGLSIAVACCAVIVAHAVAAERSWLTRLLALRPLVWIGARSYGIYLFHFPVFEAIEGVAGQPGHARLPFGIRYALELTFSLLIAAASYRWVEARFLRRTHLKGAPPHVQESEAEREPAPVADPALAEPVAATEIE